VGIGECTLECVVLACERSFERLPIGIQNLDPSGVVLGQPRLAPDQVQGGALLRARLGQEQGAVREVERGQSPLPG
jgi:hypothetical protein